MFKRENDFLSRRILTSDWTSEQTKKERLAEKLSKMSFKFGGTKNAAPRTLLKEVCIKKLVKLRTHLLFSTAIFNFRMI
jgi:hypothetical protein